MLNFVDQVFVAHIITSVFLFDGQLRCVSTTKNNLEIRQEIQRIIVTYCRDNGKCNVLFKISIVTEYSRFLLKLSAIKVVFKTLISAVLVTNYLFPRVASPIKINCVILICRKCKTSQEIDVKSSGTSVNVLWHQRLERFCTYIVEELLLVLKKIF